MKVSLFADFKEENWPSMERYARGLGGALSAIYPNDEFRLCRPSFWRGLDNYQSIFKNLPIFRFWSNDLLLNRFINYPFFTLLNRSKINHILDHSYSHLLSFLPRGRTVVTCHDLIPLKLHNPSLPKNKYLKLFESTVKNIKKACWTIADSKATKDDLIELLGVQSEKIEVIYPGLGSQFGIIDNPLVLKEKSLQIGLREDENYLLHVGVNHPYKNVETIFRVLKILKGLGLKIELIKAGQDFTDSQKQLIKDLGVSDAVILFLNPSDEDLNIIYNSCSVLVCPSLLEGFGWPVLEALSCGLPVICSDRGSLNEVGGDNVFYTDPNDLDKITALVLDVLKFRQNPQFLNRQEVWQKWAKRFTWGMAAQKTHQVYEKISAQ